MGNNNTSQPGDPDHHFAPPSPPTDTDYRHARWPRIVLGTPPPEAIQNPKLALERSAGSKIQNPKIVVVGVCSSGKSTLVVNLKAAGYDARACSQEHSYVPHLWQLSKPDVLIYLDASIHTIRRRRRAKWRREMLDEEHRRLAHARQHCNLYIPTDGLAPEDVASRVVGFIRNQKSEVRSQTATSDF